MPLPKKYGIERGWPIAGGQVVTSGTNPPAGFVFLMDPDGALLMDDDGALLIEAA